MFRHFWNIYVSWLYDISMIWFCQIPIMENEFSAFMQYFELGGFMISGPQSWGIIVLLGAAASMYAYTCKAIEETGTLYLRNRSGQPSPTRFRNVRTCVGLVSCNGDNAEKVKGGARWKKVQSPGKVKTRNFCLLTDHFRCCCYFHLQCATCRILKHQLPIAVDWIWVFCRAHVAICRFQQD